MAATWFALALIMVVVAPLGFFLLLILLTFLKDLMSGRDSDRLTKAEAQQFQRMCHSLDRMEERMANLETILKSREPEAPQDLRGKGGIKPMPHTREVLERLKSIETRLANLETIVLDREKEQAFERQL